MKDFDTFKRNFKFILTDIPNVRAKEQIYRCCRKMQSSIWKELCSRDFTTLLVMIGDA